MSQRFRVNEGDWVCLDAQCANVNFARRTSCNRCGKEKAECPKKKQLGTEIGKAAAEKSGGLFSADDWQCSKCGNVNWARRQQCNMCNAPKFGEVEERTGYGGGYNERENVEYIERDESDGEYDEFGRKKKKFRGSTTKKTTGTEESKKINASRMKDSVKLASKAEDDEEEDEEDDDSGDLSKYDLSGWGDEDDDDDDEDEDLTNSNNSKDVKGTRDSREPKKTRSGSSSGSRSRSHSPYFKTDSTYDCSRMKRSRSRSRSSSPNTRHYKRRHSRSRSRSRDRCRRSKSSSSSPSSNRRSH